MGDIGVAPAAKLNGAVAPRTSIFSPFSVDPRRPPAYELCQRGLFWVMASGGVALLREAEDVWISRRFRSVGLAPILIPTRQEKGRCLHIPRLAFVLPARLPRIDRELGSATLALFGAGSFTLNIGRVNDVDTCHCVVRGVHRAGDGRGRRGESELVPGEAGEGGPRRPEAELPVREELSRRRVKDQTWWAVAGVVGSRRLARAEAEADSGGDAVGGGGLAAAQHRGGLASGEAVGLSTVRAGPEVVAASASSQGRRWQRNVDGGVGGCGGGGGRGRGRNHGYNPGHGQNRHGGYNFKNKSYHRKWENNGAKHDKEKNGNPPKNVENACYRCGMTGHWEHTCRTARHLVDLYQASLKEKGKNIESNNVLVNDDFDITHLDVEDYLGLIENKD
nr:Retrovirus-related Pol polyprotein from transposon TNT 1-94 [Ipomoea batatas]